MVTIKQKKKYELSLIKKRPVGGIYRHDTLHVGVVNGD